MEIHLPKIARMSLLIAALICMSASAVHAVCSGGSPNGSLESGEECDDGNTNAGDCCSATCEFEPDATSCDDGLFCTVGDTCTSGTCSGQPRDCDDQNPCTDTACEEFTSQCVAVPKPENSPCDDGILCTVGSVCDSGFCAFGSVQDTDGDGLCDLADPCPAQSDNTRCEASRSFSGVIGSSGGTLQTSEVVGTISTTIVIPAGALDADTVISVTENAPATDPSRFSTRKQNTSVDVLSISVRPEGQAFNVPVEVTIRWDDRDKDGLADRGLCQGGSDDGLPCDHDEDCASNSCSVNANVVESELVLKRNNTRFSKEGLGINPFTCADHAPGGACEVAAADCSGDPSNNPLAVVAKCCDPSAGPTGTRTFGEWTFETCDFSEFLAGLDVSALVPGKGSVETDCHFEWAPYNPLNEKYLDSKGLPNFKQSCSDGDPVCDRDGLANGECTFEIGMCANMVDPRLQTDGVVECAPSDMASWRLIRPKWNSDDPDEANNAAGLLLLGAANFGSILIDQNDLDKGKVIAEFTPEITEPQVCISKPVPIVVPLKDGIEKAKAVLKIRAETTAPPGEKHGDKDTDKLKLTCVPAE